MVRRSTTPKESNIYEADDPPNDGSDFSGTVLWTNLVPNTRYTAGNLRGFDGSDPITIREDYTFPNEGRFNTDFDGVLLRVEKGTSVVKLNNGYTGALSFVFPTNVIYTSTSDNLKYHFGETFSLE